MGARHPNPRLVKIHRNYSVEDIARLFDVHKNTVRSWLKQGLAAIDDRRPTLILGREQKLMEALFAGNDSLLDEGPEPQAA